MSMFFPFGEIPDDLREQLEKQAAHNEMAQEDFHHSIFRFFSDADETSMLTVKRMLHAIACSGDNMAAAYWEGMASMARLERFGICPLHEKNHDFDIPTSEGEMPNA